MGRSIKGIIKNPLWRKENLINLTMKNLTDLEMRAINGGLPQAYYMDDDVINANGHAVLEFCELVGKVIKPFWKEIVKWAFLG